MLKKPFLELSHMLSKKPAVANLHRIFSGAPLHENQLFIFHGLVQIERFGIDKYKVNM